MEGFLSQSYVLDFVLRQGTLQHMEPQPDRTLGPLASPRERVVLLAQTCSHSSDLSLLPKFRNRALQRPRGGILHGEGNGDLEPPAKRPKT